MPAASSNKTAAPGASHTGTHAASPRRPRRKLLVLSGLALGLWVVFLLVIAMGRS